MASNSEPAPDAQESARNQTLERCLEVLHDAKNDSEQFAALLLVTKTVRASDIDAKTRRRIFNAVGFTFPHRLLVSQETPTGCSQHVYRSLGLTLLACFCTDPDLAGHPQVLNKIQLLNETIVSDCEANDVPLTSMIDDAYQCLNGILATSKGPTQMVSNGTLPCLSRVYLHHSYGWHQALDLLARLLTTAGAKCWKKCKSDLVKVLSRLSRDFQKAEDMSKFKLCEILPRFLPPSPLLMESSWGVECQRSIYQGLARILSSKLDESRRNPALQLAGCLVSDYNADWILAESRLKNSKFLALLVNLACVEVRLCLEEPDPGYADSRQNLITACYAAMELGIQECTREESLLTEAQKLQLIAILQEACGAIMYYLNQVGWQRMEDPFIFASVRILSAWLAEETSALKEEVCELLPFLIQYSRTRFQLGAACRDLPRQVAELALCSSSWGSLWPGDALRFLLPALCHLTAEERPRRILIAEGAPALLLEYFQHLWDTFASDEHSSEEVSLQTACGIFLNLVVTAPDLVRQEHCFSSLMTLLLTSLPTLLQKKEHLVLAANVATLGLMMARLLASSQDLGDAAVMKEFFRASILFLRRAHVSEMNRGSDKLTIAVSGSYKAAWGDMSELWFLGMQAFASCVPLLTWLPQEVLDSRWIQDVLELLGSVCPTSVDLELVSAFQGILKEQAEKSPACKELILSQGGAEKANLYGMAALEQCLCEESKRC
ncbi:neurochondrin [Microcaecilia unicolor]|uniref:Neurochondrin n=1 Tax=Microcaecilia unicolor TaxID=1415580 RepID=A0A6P7ZFW1_9AMPH|nr:neurochondrin [Microcaecilia unicolor]XP_030074295.1 neurochondrin [Microcaecilia unicolor]XP_030074296.1 neurochondrin [Microcaecilia unicolor]XP_030074297.1 neurochondrin [Microcaecilia unicolor]